MTKEKKKKIKIDASAIISLFVLFFGAFQFSVIKFNDFKHVEDNQKETVRKIEDLGKNMNDKFISLGIIVTEQGKSISKIEGYILSKQEGK